LRWQGIKRLGTCHIGLAFDDLLLAISSDVSPQTGSFKRLSISLASLLEVFSTEDYILWFNAGNQTARIALKDRATTVSQLKAWSHALRVAQACSEATTRKIDLDAQATLMILRDTLRVHNETFDKYFKRLEDAGWNTLIAALETKFGRRIRVEEHKMSVQS
jgi:hypothetical protein